MRTYPVFKVKLQEWAFAVFLPTGDNDMCSSCTEYFKRVNIFEDIFLLTNDLNLKKTPDCTHGNIELHSGIFQNNYLILLRQLGQHRQLKQSVGVGGIFIHRQLKQSVGVGGIFNSML